MSTYFRRVISSAFLVLFFGVRISAGADELIEPTRSLDGPRTQFARLTVVSEPPGLEVFLDGAKLGQTPIWMKQVPPGTRKVRMGDSETDVSVGPGKTVTLSFFQGSFIDISKESEAAKQAAREPQKQPAERKGTKPAEEERPRGIDPFIRFLNRTSPTF